MGKRKYAYDPQKQVLIVYDGKKVLGYYGGGIAEQEFEKLLETDAIIEIGSFEPTADLKV
jgi:hypothetical protein